MKRRDVLIGLGGMAATPALAQISAPATTPPAGATARISCHASYRLGRNRSFIAASTMTKDFSSTSFT